MKFWYGKIHGGPVELEVFKKSIMINESFSWPWQKTKESSDDDLAKKLNTLYEACELLLDVFPKKTGLTIDILRNGEAVVAKRQSITNIKPKVQKRAAFIDLRTNTIYVAADLITPRILRHEFGHSLAESILKVKISYNAHEALAKYCEVG